MFANMKIKHSKMTMRQQGSWSKIVEYNGSNARRISYYHPVDPQFSAVYLHISPSYHLHITLLPVILFCIYPISWSSYSITPHSAQHYNNNNLNWYWLTAAVFYNDFVKIYEWWMEGMKCILSSIKLQATCEIFPTDCKCRIKTLFFIYACYLVLKIYTQTICFWICNQETAFKI